MPRLSKIGAAALAAFGWTSGSAAVTVDFLVVAGGGGGGRNNSVGDGGCGGGGAGGYRTGTASLNPTLSYTVTVGAGGAGGAQDAAGSNGSDSIFSTITSTGGGGGGDSQSGVKRAGDGGSGGGAGYINSAAGSGNTPSTSPSQGNNGGAYVSGDHGAGGGGATAAGSSTAGSPGAGGAGTPLSISGSSVTYAGGGGGGGYNATGALGGSGGGGQGGSNGAAGVSGTANLGGGGGGGGGGSSPPTAAGAGGAGVVIISYVGAQQFGGGVVTSSGGNTIHTFTTSGTLSPLNSLTASYLIVAGGGGGSSSSGGGGGGGAGGLLSGSSLTIDTNSIYAVTVGAGGAGGLASIVSAGSAGSNSSFSIVSTSAVGGGQGVPQGVGGNGGSGGGGGDGNNDGALAGGTGTSGQGNNGGSSANQTGGGGGGAGAGAVGGNGNASGNAGNGGNGASSSISGSAVTYAGGGGGGQNTIIGTGAGTGGSGGGGNGGKGAAGANATGNGSGGGGAGRTSGVSNYDGGSGSSGIVIISYPGSTQQMAGGTVTVAGGNVIHTFTSSGYLTPIVLVNNSLRFRASNNAYLNRTFSTPTNNKLFTWSGWVKRSQIGVWNDLFGAGGSNGFGFNTAWNDNGLAFFTNNVSGDYFFLVTTQVFRDPSAWYHIVLAVDTTQATPSNRAKIYVNGVQITAFNSPVYQSQGSSLTYNSATAHYLGSLDGSIRYFDGYMADINFIDGQQLTPNSFGTFNGLGVWQPIRYGGSYGTNGFYLPFNQGSSTFAGSFNGSSQWLTWPANLTFGTNNFTVECWVYFTGFPNAAGGFGATLFRQDPAAGRIVDIFVEQYKLKFYSPTIGVDAFLGTETFTTGQWYHVAVVKNGNTITGYVNGTALSSPQTGNGSSIGNMAVVSTGKGDNYTQGYVSNLRVVNGTAVYTSAFVPTTSPLTNISNTNSLILQSATVIDNSSNAWTITNNGGVTMSAYSNVFANPKSLCVDNSPAQNNWTPNNISNNTNSTYDSMTDVPTLTNATTANYAVLNPLSTAATLSDGNLKVASLNNYVYATQYPTSGKWYWEFTMDAGGSYNHFVGVITPNGATYAAIALANGGNSPNTFVVATSTNGTLTQPTGSRPTQPATIGVKLDISVGSLEFLINGTVNGSITGISNWTNEYWIPFFSQVTNTFSYQPVTVNFGQQPFVNALPSGFFPLNTFNFPTPAIGATASTLASQNFNAVLYSGNNSTQTITVGFQPDFMWSKCTNFGRSHRLIDSVRGLSYQSFSDSVDGGNTYDATSYVSSITSTSSSGFAITNGGTDQYNTSGENYVSWAWKANGSGSTNTAGSIISTVSSNTTAGFSIVTYTGNATSGATVGHGCQVGGIATAPSMVILKGRSLSTNWYVYHPGLTSASYQIYLNLTSQQDNSVTTAFNSVAPGATTFTLPGTGFGSNNSGERYVAYCFAAVPGYSAFGTYTGNSSATGDGPFVYTGFRPRFVLWKNRTTGSQWILLDTARNTYNVSNAYLEPNTPDTENTANTVFDMLSNGFKIRNTGGTDYNASGEVYIYVAFAENPFKYANAR